MYPVFVTVSILLLATSISASPVEDAILPLDIPDGAYTVHHNDIVAREVLEFVPLEEMNVTDVAIPLEKRGLEARAAKTVCEGGALDRTNLIRAWQCLMNYVGSGKTFGKDYASYVSIILPSNSCLRLLMYSFSFLLFQCKVGGVVAYVCNYEVNTVTRDVIQNAMSAVSLGCGDLTKGYERCKQSCGTPDSSIGRKDNGADFCWKGFKGQ
jgi:hypothetical protein